MNKDICKNITNCALCKREKVRTQIYPLQMTDILNIPFDKIAIDLVTYLNIATSGNQHILTITDHLTGWPEAFPVHNKKVDTIVCVLMNNYLPIHMPLQHTVWQWGRVQEQINGQCPPTTRHWLHIFCQISPTK